MAAVSYVGSTQFGGTGLLPYGWDLLLVAVVALAFYGWGVRSGWRTTALDTERGTDDLASIPTPPTDPRHQRHWAARPCHSRVPVWRAWSTMTECPTGS